MGRLGRRVLLAVVFAIVVLGGVVYALNVRDETPIAAGAAPVAPHAEQVERGAYLARVGNCAACHTSRGGPPYAGGRGIATPFGTVYASNLTPDARHGIGSWSPDHFWRALHNGRSKDGRLLYPAFPYPNYTIVTRPDADALFAYLRSLVPVAQPNRAHALRFPYDSQPALAVWRALFFTPAAFEPDASKSAEWNRGAYLVRGLGHCNACHGGRNVLGATEEGELGGGLIPMQNWYAPSLASPREAGVADWPIDEVVRLMKSGVSARASVMGPMAGVVYSSTQHLAESDLRAMAVFLRGLPQVDGESAREAARLDPGTLERGARIYREHCRDCHGESGEGAGGAYPALAGNRAVTLDSPANVVRVIVSGGFPPSTAGNPRPYGMPPFVHVLQDAEIAAVATYVRNAWGNAAGGVRPSDVARFR